MENVMALAVLAGVMLLSLWLALGLVWLGLLAAFHLMPNSPRRLRAAAPPAREPLGLRWAVVQRKSLPRAFKAGLGR